VVDNPGVGLSMTSSAFVDINPSDEPTQSANWFSNSLPWLITCKSPG
jgi:hypothetical protein